jgi:hypothetical protein
MAAILGEYKAKSRGELKNRAPRKARKLTLASLGNGSRWSLLKLLLCWMLQSGGEGKRVLLREVAK